MKDFGKRMGWLGLAVTGLISSLALQMILGAAGGVISVIIESLTEGVQGGLETLQSSVMEGAMWGVVAYHVLSIPLYWLWYYFGCGRRKPVSPAKVITGWRFLVILIAGFGMCVLANGMVAMEEFLLPAHYEQYLELMEQVGFGENILMIIASILLAPIGEELLCRGVIFHYCRKAAQGLGSGQTAFWIANVLQALFFAIMHGNLIQGTYAFVLGLGLGYLCYHYRSLYPSMLAHFLVNFISTYIMGYVLAGVPENLLSGCLLLCAGAVMTAAAIAMSRRKTEDAADGWNGGSV